MSFKYNLFQVWLLAARPQTLSAAVAPVLIGLAMAFAMGKLNWPIALATLGCALLIQIGTNFVNDYYDFKKGTDNAARIGPTRVTQSKLVTPTEIKAASVGVFSLVLFLGIYLIWHGGWFIFWIGITAILSGIFYTAGPVPLGYLGLGEIFVFIFFGPLAVAGTYFLQTQQIGYLPFLAGVAPGLLSVAILTVNNLRDIDSDRQARKKTLAVRFGKRFAQNEYLLCIILASLFPFILYMITLQHMSTLSASSLILLALPLIHVVYTYPEENGKALNAILAKTGKLLMIYSILFAIGWLI